MCGCPVPQPIGELSLIPTSWLLARLGDGSVTAMPC